MFIKVSRKIIFAVFTLPALLLFALPAIAEEANLDAAQLDQTSDLIRQADNINETDMSQVHVDNGNGDHAPASTELSEQEREVYQRAQEQFDQEQTALSRNTKHQETPSVMPQPVAPTNVTAENNHSVAQVDDDIEKYRVQAESNDRLIQEN